MNRESVRKRRERHLLDRFLSTHEVEPDAVEEGEAPDFLLCVDSKVIGVEVTEIFRSDDSQALSPRAKENITDRIVARARALFHERSKTFVHVNVLFFDGMDVQTLNRDEVALRLAELVHSLPLSEQHVHWRNQYSDPTLDAIAFVTALKVPEASMSHWGVARAGWRAPLQTQLLRAAIDSKNEKVTSYRSKASEVWLLLAVEGSKPSQFFDPDAPPEPSSLASEFDRTYWFNAMHHQVVCWLRGDA